MPQIKLNSEADSPRTIRAELLDAAKQYVLRDRNANYDAPEKNFEIIADLCNVFFADKLAEGKKISPSDVAIFQILVKLSRIKKTPSHFDSWVDLAGYAACGAEAELGNKNAQTTQ